MLIKGLPLTFYIKVPETKLQSLQAKEIPPFLADVIIRHVNDIPTMQFFTGISRINHSKSYMLSLTECVWDFQNNAFWDA